MRIVRSESERIADVRAVLEAGRKVRALADASPTPMDGATHPSGGPSTNLFLREMAASTGLSVEGVRLGLHEHLEVDAADADIARLVASASDADQVAVILSANAFVGALRAIAIALATAPKVMVRPSSREPYMARALVHALADARVTLADGLDVATIRSGEVHVYGRDETIAAIRLRTPPPVIVRGHGSGLGVAVVTNLSTEDAASLVAADVVPFDQRGCLSPRLVLVVGEPVQARRFGEALASRLTERQREVPRGELTPDERAEAARYRGTVAFAGELFDGPEHAVGVADELLLPPPGRHVHVMPLSRTQSALEAPFAAAIEPIRRHVAALGTDATGRDASALVTALPRARHSPLGRMQKPSFDGPVDRRV